MSTQKKKRYPNSTFMSGVVGICGFLEILFSMLLLLGGFGLMNSSLEVENTNQLLEFFGTSLGIVVIATGGFMFLSGALLISVSQAVGLSRQNNEMLKDIIKRNNS